MDDRVPATTTRWEESAVDATPQPTADAQLVFQPFSDRRHPSAANVDKAASTAAEPASRTAREDSAPDHASPIPSVVDHEVVFADEVLRIRLDSSVVVEDEEDVQRRRPQLTWTGLPHVAPSDGAFVYLGTADEGCLFINLAAAPGPIALGGEPAAVTKIADSIVLQAMNLADRHRPHLFIVGSVARRVRRDGNVHRCLTLNECVKARADVGPNAEFQLVVCAAAELAKPDALDHLREAATSSVVALAVGALPTAPWQITALDSGPGVDWHLSAQRMAAA